MKAYLALALAALMCATPQIRAEEDPRTEWFRDAHFGMFIHFGLYSIPAGVWEGKRMTRNDYAEWIRYQQGWPEPGGIPKEKYDTLLQQFDPKGFDADAWISEAKNAGMKYFLITSKHHDGFALWDSKASDYNVVKATPFKRDLLGELVKACRKHGLKVGFYYSHWLDWEHPGGAQPPWPETKGDWEVKQPSQEQFEQYWTQKCLPQVKELLDNYSPDFFWFDSWGGKTKTFLTEERLDRLVNLIHTTKPACLINSRMGTEKGVDFLSMGDNFFPKQGFDKPWETSGTLNHSWGYHRLDYKWKPTTQLLRWLVDNTSRGGNYQLNVGPTGEGVFQPAAIKRLREIGAWMSVNGEGIYGSRVAKYPEPQWGRLTRKTVEGKERLYTFVYDPKSEAKMEFAGPETAPAKAWVLETHEEVKFEKTPTGLSFTMPKSIPDANITTVVFEW